MIDNISNLMVGAIIGFIISTLKDFINIYKPFTPVKNGTNLSNLPHKIGL